MTTKYDVTRDLMRVWKEKTLIRGIFRTTGKTLVLLYNRVKFPESDNTVWF